MVNHAVEIGWTAVTDKDAQAMRGGVGGAFFRGVLEAKLAELAEFNA